MLEKECELVANLTGQPPPIPMICDDGKPEAENTGGCTRDVLRKAAKDQPAEESGTMLCVLIETRKSSDTAKPAKGRFTHHAKFIAAALTLLLKSIDCCFRCP